MKYEVFVKFDVILLNGCGILFDVVGNKREAIMKNSKVLLVALIAFTLVLTGCSDAVKTKKEEVVKTIEASLVDSSSKNDYKEQLANAKTVEEIAEIVTALEAEEASLAAVAELTAAVEDLITQLQTGADMKNATVKALADEMYIYKAGFILADATTIDVDAEKAKIAEFKTRTEALV